MKIKSLADGYRESSPVLVDTRMTHRRRNYKLKILLESPIKR
jgi:hypothetical protein